MLNPLETVRYINLVDSLNYTLSLVDKYLNLKIKKLEEETKINSNNNHYIFTLYVDDKIWNKEIAMSRLDDEILKIVNHYMGVPVKIHWILNSKGEK